MVSFLTFHERGLGYPAHWFLRGLLNEWGLELQHLNPAGVLHIAGFITVCEKSSLLGGLQCATSFGGRNPFSTKASCTDSLTMDDL